MGWMVVGRREGSGGKVFTKFSPQEKGHGDRGLENSDTLILSRASLLHLNVNANHSDQKISSKEPVSIPI